MKVKGTLEFDKQPTTNSGDELVAVKVTTTAPTVNDDNTAGYYVGYKWVNTTTDTTYHCEDVTTGAAVWSSGGGVDTDAIHDNVAGEINAITEKTTPVAADKIIIEDSADSNNKKMVQLGNLPNTWRPNSVPLGSVLLSGASFFVNGGAGIYLSMSGAADDAFYFNDSLNKSGLTYDGSDLALKLHCRLSSNGTVGDTVGLLLDYGFIRNGDNSTTTVTNVAQVDYDVSTFVADNQFSLTLTTMTGISNAQTIMISVTRNSTGTAADTYPGNFEIVGIELVKV